MPGTADSAAPRFVERTLDELEIEDEPSFHHVALYRDLKEVVRRANHRFRVLPDSLADRWDHALLLNLTFYSPEQGGDVLPAPVIPADVVAHVAWHHLAAVATGKSRHAEALFLGESIASAFDIYLVGRLLDQVPDSSFLETQVPHMADTALEAGLPDAEFQSLLQSIAREPEAAFSDLRALLFDVTRALHASRDAVDALAVLAHFEGHRFAPLLHRFELSNWVLHARAWATPGEEARALAVDEELRRGPGALEWLEREWVRPAIS